MQKKPTIKEVKKALKILKEAIGRSKILNTKTHIFDDFMPKREMYAFPGNSYYNILKNKEEVQHLVDLFKEKYKKELENSGYMLEPKKLVFKYIKLINNYLKKLQTEPETIMYAQQEFVKSIQDDKYLQEYNILNAFKILKEAIGDPPPRKW